MAVMGSWTPGAIVDANADMEGKFAAVPIPGKDGGIAPSVLGGSHLSMFETAEDKDLAFAFIEMMTTGEFAQQWGEQSGYFPGQVSLLDKTLEEHRPARGAVRRSSSSTAARPCRWRRPTARCRPSSPPAR